MKKFIISVFAALFTAVAVFAQTPEEVIARMEGELESFETEGFSLIMDMKIPILGTFSSTMYTLGDKYKAVLEIKGNKAISWSDGETDWDYDSSKNEITISKATSSDADESMEALSGITDGYDVKMKKETADAWYFQCSKQKTNTDKDAPRKMDLTVSRHTYLPVSLSMNMRGVTVTLRDFVKGGVTEEEVTFDPSQYADAKIVDKR